MKANLNSPKEILYAEILKIQVDLDVYLKNLLQAYHDAGVVKEEDCLERFSVFAIKLRNKMSSHHLADMVPQVLSSYVGCSLFEELKQEQYWKRTNDGLNAVVAKLKRDCPNLKLSDADIILAIKQIAIEQMKRESGMDNPFFNFKNN